LTGETRVENIEVLETEVKFFIMAMKYLELPVLSYDTPLVPV